MAKVKITGHASGSGILTITAPNTSTNRTITLPDSTGTLATTTDVAARLPSITDGGNATAITIDSAENVGFGVTPEPHHANWTGIDIGGMGNISGETAPAAGRQFTLNNNAYLNTSENWVYKHSSDESCQLQMFDGKFRFRTAPTGTADGNVTFTERLLLTNDGRGLSQFTAKAWMKFDQYNSNTLRDSHNVSSVTDHSTGEFTMNFSNNMGNANYCVQGTGHYGASANDMGSIGWTGNNQLTTSSARFYFMSQVNNGTSGALYDVEEAMILIFGD